MKSTGGKAIILIRQFRSFTPTVPEKWPALSLVNPDVELGNYQDKLTGLLRNSEPSVALHGCFKRSITMELRLFSHRTVEMTVCLLFSPSRGGSMSLSASQKLAHQVK
jgi:hypothetical protein